MREKYLICAASESRSEVCFSYSSASGMYLSSNCSNSLFNFFKHLSQYPLQDLCINKLST